MSVLIVSIKIVGAGLLAGLLLTACGSAPAATPHPAAPAQSAPAAAPTTAAAGRGTRIRTHARPGGDGGTDGHASHDGHS